MKRTIAMIAAVALLALALAAALGGCGAPKPQKLLAGKWNAAIGSIEFKALTFEPNEKEPLKGTVTLGMAGLLSNVVKATYEIAPKEGADGQDSLKITYQLGTLSTTRTYSFTVTEDNLTLVGENSSVALNYTRAIAPEDGTTAG